MLNSDEHDLVRDSDRAETTSVYRPAATGTTGDESPGPAADALESGTEGLSAGTARLVIRRGPNASAGFLLDQPVAAAGRHTDCEIVLDDFTVSRHHAEFRRDAGGQFQIADTGSLNGTYVNHKPIDQVTLHNGDEIQIGKFRLVFQSSQ